MKKINIKPKSLSIFGVANKIALNIDFYMNMETFTIYAQFYNEETPIGTKVPLFISMDVQQEWGIIALNNPEKATFLNFSIIKDWCSKQLEIEYV
jgi:hypothetical protein